MKIKDINAYEILASGGFPTVECKVTLEDGTFEVASVPYGVSAGSHEALVLNDGDKSRFGGAGMLNAVNNINTEIRNAVLGMNAENQEELDTKMITLDGTEDKSRLGGNAILAVSLAVGKAVSKSMNKPFYKHIAESFGTNPDYSNLPNPMIVVIEGGKHADNTTDLQEFCITAIKKQSVSKNIEMAMESYHELKKILKQNNLSTNVGNEGAFAPNGIPSNEAPFNYILEAIENAGFVPGVDLKISIDAAASEFFEDGLYNLKLESKKLNSNELMDYYKSWMDKYPIVSFEDMFSEDDWDSWITFNKICNEKGIFNLGDDLTVTNPKRLQRAIELDAINAILIKLNQIGTLSETVKACMMAKEHKLITVPSHRGGGETNDTSMVDLAVAVGASFIKVGPTRGERVAKYNRLMEIEREISFH